MVCQQIETLLTAKIMIRKRIMQLNCTLLILCSFSVTGCGNDDEPVIVGGPTAEILEWQAKNRAEFEAAAKAEHGG